MAKAKLDPLGGTVVELPYRPHNPATGSQQRDFHEARYRKRYRACYAGTGGGKTFGAAFEVLAWMLENPPGVALCCEPDFRRIWDTMVPAFEAHLGGRLDASPLTLKFDQQKGEWRLVNGWVVWFRPLDKPGKEEGPNVDLVWVDETRLVRSWGGPEGIWEGLRRRLRGSRAGNRMGCILTSHSPTEEQDAWFRGREDAQVFRWSTHAARRAGTLPAEYEEVIRSYTGKAAERVLEGKYAMAEGLVYDQFDPDRHVRPWPRRADGRPMPADAMSYGVDWGWTMPACVTAVAWRGETSHVVEEFYGSHYGIEHIAQALQRMTTTWGSGLVHCGHDKPEHVAKLVEGVRLPDGTVLGPFDASSFTGRRVADGCDLLNDKLRGDTHYVDPMCVNTIREKKSYARKPGTDEPEKGDDHSQDAERYAVVGGPGESLGAW
jgi:hypothetical protein